ncbi:MAG TPA: 16S rRNA (adenine(1518)-N(6)/adenine(1519)-N(6))-dimethyltransferase RsmA [Candidatus Saccharimonadia bacterium]|jgi:16S rRNA (adenine1518-N6/adenine1519-N6)-dimethyltransferase|nr:16S rRNA (adenine(1518)-N(6)/adenine(1519)-N(6))-dimethyltransferase RsmA [Candidatus Saccharimonadia bacterium]
MDLTRVEDVRTAMRLAGIKPNKGLGQHFLVDRPSLEAIMGAAEITATDTVLEIGPGLGVMTRPLTAQAARVVAVETDHVLAGLLERDAPANLEVVEQDILVFDFSRLPAGYKVIANIPYYLTSKIFRLLIEHPNPPSVMSLLIQKEVAERIVARPGQLSILALSVQYYGRPEIVQVVERHKFWPAPDVDSAVLRVTLTGPAFPADTAKLFRLIKAGFGEKRKQLKNALAGGLNLSSELAAAVVAAAGLGATARAQELNLPAWQRLYNECEKREII